ncbi:MAG TPA: hypothetical protein VFC23_14055 [Thermoanaerobaculia bacterium]|nr:hypothetical protein [Thermoanaerobaculia bacterium]
MIRNAGFRTFVLLLLVLLLAASPAMAAGKELARQKSPSLVTWLRKALDRLVPGIAEGRDGMDPNGSPAPTSGSVPAPGTPTDGRGGMDPDGRT